MRTIKWNIPKKPKHWFVIRGRPYTVNNLDQLAEELSMFNITSTFNEHCLGFFGMFNPLSNFHEAKFNVEGIEYISSERYIQSCKAKFSRDRSSYDRIMNATSSLECKNSGRQVRGFDNARWESVAKELCTVGIREKILQNLDLMRIIVKKHKTRQ